jgi:site-specific recombinase XerD
MFSPPAARAPVAPRLLDQVRERVRYLHYSLRTEEAYVHWIRAFVRYHGRRHPREMGGPQVEAFLSWLSGDRGVSVSTHRQALSALLFLYQQVLGQQLPWMEAIGRPQRKPRLPVVLSPAEVAAVLALLDGTHGVLARLLYGTGMRTVQELPGHSDVSTTMIYTHVLKVAAGGTRSPLDALPCAARLVREPAAGGHAVH